jgi:hypothetical protein
MNHPGPIWSEMRRQCVDDCSRFFVDRGDSRPLTPAELRAIAKDKKLTETPFAGWETCLIPGNPPVMVHVLVDSQFPYSAPSIVLQGKIMFCAWPHVESRNQLCIISQIDRRAIMGGSDMIEAALKRAVEVVQQGIAGANVDDFAEEMHSYWAIHAPGLSINLLNYEMPCLLDVRMHRGRTMATDPRVADVWYGRLGIPEAQPWCAGCYIPLADPLLPPDFPKTVGDFRSLLAHRQIEDPIHGVKHGEISPFYYVLGVHSGAELAGTSRTLLGLRLDAPSSQIPRPVRPEHQDPRTYRRYCGFRPGKLKAPYDLRRSFPDSDEAQRIMVHRCDGAWIHTRGGTGNQQQLAKKHVIVIGCGSLGSSVAVLLAKAGIGRLTLFDFDALTWGNPARHELGGLGAIGKRKNLALADDLQGRFPHLMIDGRFPGHWQEHYQSHPEEWGKADLVITTTADWPSDFALSAAHRHDGRITCPVMFGFVEAHAAAGQVIRVDLTGSCYRCGTDDHGLIQRTVFNWGGKEQIVKEQACGAFFQPYGAADLAPSGAMIAKAGIDCLMGRPASDQRVVRIGDTEQARALGAEINESSGVPAHDVDLGSREVRCAWPPLPGCPVCGG